MQNTKRLFLLICFLSLYSVWAQRFEYVYKNVKDSSFNCYLKAIPETDSIKGLVIRDYSSLPDTATQSPFQFETLCVNAGIMVLYTSTSTHFPELYATDSSMNMLDNIVREVIAKYAIPKQNIFIGGISASGTRALRYAQYCASGKSNIRIKAVFAVDSPLDLERFYNSAFTHKKHFKEGMLWEANHMLPYFEKLFGCRPDQNKLVYQNASVFTQSDSTGGNAIYLKNTPILLFHEPDIDWWMEERGASYMDINSYDIAAFAVQLKALGNTRVEVITTTGKGFDREGKRKCHSWTIVDEAYLLGWIVGLLG